MKPMPSRSVISFTAPAMSKACCRVSSWQGPAISTKGLSLAISRLPIRTVWFAGMTGLHQTALLDRRFHEGAEQRMRLEGLRLQLRMILHADIPGMIRYLDDLRQQPVGRNAGHQQARRLDL